MEYILSKEQVEEMILKKVWDIRKETLIKIFKKYNIKYDYKKTSHELKKEFLNNYANDLDMLEVYREFKKHDDFGLLPSQLMEILNISPYYKKKLELNGFLKVMYYRDYNIEGKTKPIAFYDIEFLNTITFDDLEKAKKIKVKK